MILIFVISFLEFFYFLILVTYQSIELDLLYKTVYMTFFFSPNIGGKKFKYYSFRQGVGRQIFVNTALRRHKTSSIESDEAQRIIT
jgi:hypothetical protein